MSKKIVLADDEKFIAIAYKDGLMRAGFDVTVAHDGAEALEKVKEVHPDLVLLDLIMPRMDGFEVLKAIKSDPALQSLPVMILSNLSQPADEQETRRLGAADFIVKSDLSLQEVIERIGKVIAAQAQ